MERFKPVPEYYQWAHMVSPHYGVVALGFVVGNQIIDIRATIERIPDGKWFYHIYDTPFQGVEPSLGESIKTVTKIIKSLAKVQCSITK